MTDETAGGTTPNPPEEPAEFTMVIKLNKKAPGPLTIAHQDQREDGEFKTLGQKQVQPGGSASFSFVAGTRYVVIADVPGSK